MTAQDRMKIGVLRRNETSPLSTTRCARCVAFCGKVSGLSSTKGAHGVCREWYSSRTVVIPGRSSVVKGFPVTPTSLSITIKRGKMLARHWQIVGPPDPSHLRNRYQGEWVLIGIVASLYHGHLKCNVAGRCQKVRITTPKSDVGEDHGKKSTCQKWWRINGNPTPTQSSQAPPNRSPTNQSSLFYQ